MHNVVGLGACARFTNKFSFGRARRILTTVTARRGGGDKADMPQPRGDNKQKGGKGPVFGNGDKVLDRGVWKRYKYCAQCKLIIVERAKFKGCWEDVKYCGDKCRKMSKQKTKTSESPDSE